jgi:ABC-type maltose transport system permease subunit
MQTDNRSISNSSSVGTGEKIMNAILLYSGFIVVYMLLYICNALMKPLNHRPESELATGHNSLSHPSTVITHSAPDSIVQQLHTSSVCCCTTYQSNLCLSAVYCYIYAHQRHVLFTQHTDNKLKSNSYAARSSPTNRRVGGQRCNKKVTQGSAIQLGLT